jgi:hypothetical protein
VASRSRPGDFQGRVVWFGELGAPVLGTAVGGLGGVRREWIRAGRVILLPFCRCAFTAIMV